MTTHALALSSDRIRLPLRRFVRWLMLTVVIVLLLWLAAPLLSPWYRLGINGTDSLPGLVYLVLKTEIPDTRGDLIAFYPPANRFYPRKMFFIKKVMGLPGDRVTRRSRDFAINGVYLATAKMLSRTGRPLQPGPTGVIPDDHYFVWTPHPNSYDSRYEDIGWIPQDRVIGRAVRLL